MLAFIGILSGLIFVIGDIPYILDILKGKTKPHRTTWLIFFLLDVIFLANQTALGARATLWLVSSWTVVTLIIFLLSIKRGVGGSSKLDIACLVGAVLGLVLWAILKTPLASLYSNLAVSVIAYIPTIKKAYFMPESETKISWLTATIAALLSCVSVGSLRYSVLLLPLFGAVSGAIVFILLLIRSKQKHNQAIR